MIKDRIENKIQKGLGIKELELDYSSRYGDFSVSPGRIRKFGLDIDETAKKIGTLLADDADRVEVESGFINIHLSNNALGRELELMNDDLDKYLKDECFQDKVVVFDYSQPNIAKPFSVGHLRSTVIGQANFNIHRALGYKTIGINHIGDWGTQFGKLIYAVNTWGDRSKIEKDPIHELVALYQKFHREAEQDPQLNDDAAQWFRRLELHDEEATKLWKECIKWSFAEFDRLYKVLDVKIDHTVGESFYADKTDAVIRELKTKGLLTESEGAQIVELDGIPPAIIQKSNESTLYMTRDLATVKYRVETYNPSEIIYHVGNDQALHFQQLFAVVKKLGWAKNTKLTFAGHGMMRLPEGKMSTRAGRVVLLDDLIDEARKRVSQIFKQHEAKIDADKTTRIAVSAIKYSDLSSNRKSDVIFSYDRMLDLRGNSSVYLQYTYARLQSLLKEYEKRFTEVKLDFVVKDNNRAITKDLILFKSVLLGASQNSTPNLICEYLFNLCNSFNAFYEQNRIITEDESGSSQNISLCVLLSNVIGKGMDLLGVDKFEKI